VHYEVGLLLTWRLSQAEKIVPGRYNASRLGSTSGLIRIHNLSVNEYQLMFSILTQNTRTALFPRIFSVAHKPFALAFQYPFTTSQPFHLKDSSTRCPSNIMADTTQQDHLDVEERMQSRPSRPRGDKGRGKGGGGGGQGREVQVSKALSRLLRHQAANAGIQLDDEGYAPLDSVVSDHVSALNLGRICICTIDEYSN
jgi:hypothetical protein